MLSAMSSHPAGKPVEATIHQARTKPEATSFAIKNRQTSDWFRHDAMTMSTPTDSRNKQPGGLTTGDWLIHDGKLRSEPPAAPVKRCLNQQAQATHDRVQGRQEDWYKHDDNRFYNDPLRADRASDAGKKVRCGKICQIHAVSAYYCSRSRFPMSCIDANFMLLTFFMLMVVLSGHILFVASIFYNTVV
jgi:hypothetical protein